MRCVFIFAVFGFESETNVASSGLARSKRMSLSAVTLWNTVPFSHLTTVLGPVPRSFSKPVSYTHLTLPTIYSV